MTERGMSEQTPRTDAAENPHTKNYTSLAAMPSEVLASRVVGSLILAKGNLNQYDSILTGMITLLRKDYDDTLAAQRAALLELAARIRREGMQGVANEIEGIVGL